MSAGAEWLLGGFALLRRAPLGLGLLGVIWGVLSMVALLIIDAVTSKEIGLLPLLFLILLVALASTLFFAGLVRTAHEIDQGRSSTLASFLAGMREGHVVNMLLVTLPQVLAAPMLGILLIVILGSEGLRITLDVMVKLQEMAQSGGQPDQQAIEALVSTLPGIRILLWLLIGIFVSIALSLALFLSVPQILFSNTNGFTAMRNSLRASLHNAGAVLVYLLLTGIALFAINFATWIVALIAQMVFGMTVGLMIGQLLMMAVVMPLLAGSVYAAWKQLFGAPSGSGANGVPLAKAADNVIAA